MLIEGSEAYELGGTMFTSKCSYLSSHVATF